VAPAIAGASLAVFELLDKEPALRERLMENARTFREGMTQAGFTIKSGIHPIVPIMLGDARLAGEMAKALLAEGIYVIGFSYPVVPKGEARIRVQLSAAHEPAHVQRAIEAFCKVGRQLGVC
jgi:glycine C-acetyltransferase